MPGRAAAGQRYRRRSHRALPHRHPHPALLAAALWLLLAAVIRAEPAPDCLLSGRMVADDGPEFPAVQRADNTLACMPADTALGREVHERFSALLPSHAFETRGELQANGATTADLYEALHAISTLQGIRYFSVLHRGERVLFKTAHAIDTSGAVTADPVPAAGRGVAYALVDDASFGRAPYRLEYRTADDAILLIVSNPLPLSVMRIRLIDSDRLLIALLIAPAGSPGTGQADADPEAGSAESWTMYGMVAAQAPHGSFLERFVETSLRSRLAAMQDWIAARAAAVARPQSDTGSEADAGSAGAAQG